MISAVRGSSETTHVALFKRWMSEELWMLKPDPRAMSPRTDGDGDTLVEDLSNFASWLPSEMAQDLDSTMTATKALREVLGGFHSLQASKSASKLEATFITGSKHQYVVGFDDLSDGQRQLCALYFVQHLVMKPGRLLILDEPDNYVALREIQPWLLEALDLALSENGPQLCLSVTIPS